jgi:hypothetical protein
MPIIAKGEGGSFVPVPEGVHRAICYGIVDLGMQYSEKFERTAHKILIMWEFPDELIKTDDGEKPCVISREYTLSLHEKSALRKELEAWRGKAFTTDDITNGFDILNVLGKGCQIQINHAERSGNTYANIVGVMALPKTMKIDRVINKQLVFDMNNPDTFTAYNKLPRWIRERVDKSLTWKEIQKGADNMAAPTAPIIGDDDDDDLPF